MKTLIIINCIVAIITIILTFEVCDSAKNNFKKDYPNAKLNVVSPKTKLISSITLIIRVLIPIYNIFCLLGVLFMRDRMIEIGYEQLIDRMIED